MGSEQRRERGKRTFRSACVGSASQRASLPAGDDAHHGKGLSRQRDFRRSSPSPASPASQAKSALRPWRGRAARGPHRPPGIGRLRLPCPLRSLRGISLAPPVFDRVAAAAAPLRAAGARRACGRNDGGHSMGSHRGSRSRVRCAGSARRKAPARPPHRRRETRRAAR